MDLNVFISALKHGATIDGDLDFQNSGGTATLKQGLPFIAAIATGTGSLDTSATGTPILASSLVTEGRRIYLTGFSITTTGSWLKGGVGTIRIEDSSGTPFAQISVDGLKNGATINIASGSVNLSPAFYLGTGGTPAAGLRVVADTSGNFGSAAASAILNIVVHGFIK